jgi:hypothetical protein
MMMYHPNQEMPHGTTDEIEEQREHHHHDRDAEEHQPQHQRGPGVEHAEVGAEREAEPQHHAERIPENLDKNVEQTVEAGNDRHDATRENEAEDDYSFGM